MTAHQIDAVAVDGLVNLRDLGGMRTASGAMTRPGRLLRSESPHSLSESGLRDLLERGVGAVVDLRTASERERLPSPLVEHVDHVHAPIFADDDDYPTHLSTAAEVYCWWLRERARGVSRALAGIADARSAPILVHCHAGKDRTGVVVALILRLAGVGIDAVADDYALSGVQLAEMLERDRAVAIDAGMDEVRAERLFTVKREAMVETLACVDGEHGGVRALLESIGLDRARVDRLAALLLEAQWP